MSQFANAGSGALSGASAGAALGPWGALAGGVIGGVGGVLGGQGAAKSKKAAETKYRRLLQLLQTQGEAQKRDIAIGGKDERGAIAQSAIGRGIYNTSVLDSLNSQSYGREARDMASVEQGIAQGQMDVVNSRQDLTGPSPWVEAFKNLGTALPGLVKGFGGESQAPAWSSIMSKPGRAQDESAFFPELTRRRGPHTRFY